MLEIDENTNFLRTLRTIPVGIFNTSIFCKIDDDMTFVFNKTLSLNVTRLARSSLEGVNLSCNFTTKRMLEKVIQLPILS